MAVPALGVVYLHRNRLQEPLGTMSHLTAWLWDQGSLEDVFSGTVLHSVRWAASRGPFHGPDCSTSEGAPSTCIPMCRHCIFKNLLNIWCCAWYCSQAACPPSKCSQETREPKEQSTIQACVDSNTSSPLKCVCLAINNLICFLASPVSCLTNENSVLHISPEMWRSLCNKAL